ncbi:Brix domain-containing protein [Pseudomassariella vexata]|uniref:Brix domain-domain-containing protein n=1 Tax=Pseudomassariella vexata TaxID=1141098 RepID=A0A1Y2DBL1_9PEZI|nr:Brix domain-containing protein [Pseudomassariella vexata]ORY56642.1 Brix domain-domain-containing protein [Pseudomassariella vexata]
MAKRRTKKRTHVGASNPETNAPGHATAKNPKSMVIRIGAGEVGSNVSQLAKDVRQVMEPGTATRLKERRANRLRDYVTMTGPLGVTHLMLFSRSETGNTNLRMCLAPRGPTLHFRVEKYSLCKDVRRAQRHPKGGGKEFITPPLLVMNNFSTPGADANSKVPKHLESLTTTIFQSLFPPINPTTTPLKSIRRVLLLNREPAKDKDDGSFVINFRHYAITTKTAGVSKPLRRLNAAEKLIGAKKSRKGGVPNLSKLEDISDFMIGGEGGDGYMTDGTSGSEMDTDAEVEVLDNAPRKVLSSKARAAALQAQNGEGNDDVTDKVERRAVKLIELGPRMKLRMMKVEEGMCSGKTMWHETITKTKSEEQELERRWEKKLQEKEARRKEQKANVERKKKERAASGAKKQDDEEDEMDLDGNNSDLFDEMMEDGFDSEGLEGDAEEAIMAQSAKGRLEEEQWEDEDDE